MINQLSVKETGKLLFYYILGFGTSLEFAQLFFTNDSNGNSVRHLDRNRRCWRCLSWHVFLWGIKGLEKNSFYAMIVHVVGLN